MLLQLNPPLPMSTPKGEALAHILIDYGPESDLYWTVFVTATGEVWTFSNRDIRASKNITLGRTCVTEPTLSAGNAARGKNGARGIADHVSVPAPQDERSI